MRTEALGLPDLEPLAEEGVFLGFECLIDFIDAFLWHVLVDFIAFDGTRLENLLLLLFEL